MVNILTSHVPKSVQSQGLRELPKHKWAICPPPALQGQESTNKKEGDKKHN